MEDKLNKSIKYLAIVFILFNINNLAFSQNVLEGGKITGNFQMDAQYYQKDSLIGAPEVKEQMLMNAFANIIYTNDNFTAGVRYEIYQNPLLGFDSRYKGSGIPYRFATYKKDSYEITVGNFYEQFGNGLVFRTYEERNLGYDNAMDGIRIRVSPFKGVSVKGIWGNQRFFFEKGIGIVRGLDAEVSLNEICSKFENSKLRLDFGGSFVSKYQKDEDPVYILPENVAAYSGRINASYGKFSLNGEYAYKINDPSSANNIIYKTGDALYISTSYSTKGLGILLNGLKVDNMDFRSDRNMTGNSLLINYLPTLTRQHAYTLSAFYPYATQTTGQIGYQAQVNYKFKKETLLGGKYGTDFAINYSKVNAIDKKGIDTIPIGKSGTDGYKSDFISFGKETFFTDFNVEITKKLSKKLKFILNLAYFEYNKDIIEGHPGEPMVYANIAIADVSYKLNNENSLRMEFQHLATKQDKGNWALLLAEYSIAPKWFFTVSDMYNYENKDIDKRLHYYNAAITFVKGTTRFAIGYGKQRQGIICVGGVCRQVPASNGLAVTITSSF